MSTQRKEDTEALIAKMREVIDLLKSGKKLHHAMLIVSTDSEDPQDIEDARKEGAEATVGMTFVCGCEGCIMESVHEVSQKFLVKSILNVIRERREEARADEITQSAIERMKKGPQS